MTEFKSMVRILDTDIDGRKPTATALTRVKGIGPVLAMGIVHTAGVPPGKKIGELSDDEIATIQKIVESPCDHGFPSWMVNRRKDYETGGNRHLFGSELLITLREDLNRLKKIRSYRGVRHEQGLPVRGQRTKSSFRTGTTIGVKKKKKGEAPATAAAAPKEKEKVAAPKEKASPEKAAKEKEAK